MPVILGRDEFPDEVLTASDAEVQRLFIARLRDEPALASGGATARLDVWSSELRRKRLALQRRRGG